MDSRRRSRAPVRIEVSDEDLKALGWLDEASCVKVDLKKMQAKPPRAHHISQAGMENCYFLAALGSLVANSETSITDMINVNAEGKVEITFHLDYNPKAKYIYILDPTKIIYSNRSNNNAHSHDAIFILEKAYALHRLLSASALKIDDPQIKIHPRARTKIFLSLLKNNFDVEKTYSENKDDPKITKTAINDVNDYIHHYKNHLEILDGGRSAVVLQETLGVHTKTHVIMEMMQESQTLTLISLVDSIYKNNLNATEERNIAIENKSKEIFGDDFHAAFNFSSALNKLDKDGIVKFTNNLMQGFLQISPNDVDSMKDHLDKSLGSIPGISSETKEKINHYIINSMSYKRGLGRYTPYQLQIYDKIKCALKDHEHVTASTKHVISKSGREESKGLVNDHTYEIVNCYKRGELIFLVLRNPWGHSVRDYQFKDKAVDGKKMTVLSAYQRSNLDSPGLFKREKPRHHLPISESATPLTDKEFREKYKSSGHFELEFTDFIKRFNHFDITIANKAASAAMARPKK